MADQADLAVRADLADLANLADLADLLDLVRGGDVVSDPGRRRRVHTPQHVGVGFNDSELLHR